MSLIPTIYSSTDPGAPQMTGQAGAMLNLLRAVLVTGYGTGGNARSGLGWSEEYTGTNKAVFRGNTVSGSGYRVRVLDDGTAAAGGDGRSAALRGFSTMSDIDTGTDPTPTVAQFANGGIWPKSATANATARAWWAIGNERCLYLFIDVTGAGIAAATPQFFGDLLSQKAGDLHNFALTCPTAAWGGTGTASRFFGVTTNGSTPPSSSNGLVVGRAYTAAPGAVFAAAMSLRGAFSNNSRFGGGGVPYPDPVSLGLLYEAVLLKDGASSPRAWLPGLFVPLHALPLAEGAEVNSPAGLPSGTVLVAKQFRDDNPTSSSNAGEVLFARNGEWV